MADDKVRGSRLLAQRWKVEELESLLDLDLDGVRVIDVGSLGTPVPEAVQGTWRVAPAALPDLIRILFDREKVPALEIFPWGIPGPDVLVTFRAGWG